MAFLLLEPQIRAAGTILNYESHVKFRFKEEGCSEEMYDTQFLRNIRRGVKNTLPSKLDKRGALLLPLLIYNPDFQRSAMDENCLIRFATIIGFMGMLRPHTFCAVNSFFNHPGFIYWQMSKNAGQQKKLQKHSYRSQNTWWHPRILHKFPEQNNEGRTSLFPESMLSYQ